MNALGCIYEKYKHDMLALAVSLASDHSVAEDVVHDVFISFAQYAPRLQLRGRLRSYLLSSVANRCRDMARKNSRRQTRALDETLTVTTRSGEPDQLAMATEQVQHIGRALEQLPDPQKEVIILHLQGELNFREIARAQGLPLSTVQSRYRYGLTKLRSLLDGEVET